MPTSWEPCPGKSHASRWFVKKRLFRKLWRADDDGFAALIVSALKAHVVRPAWCVTVRALAQRWHFDPELAASHSLL